MALNCEDLTEVEYNSGRDELCTEVTFYSKVDYEGLEKVIYDEVDCLDWSPKSVCVPRGKQVTLWDECEY